MDQAVADDVLADRHRLAVAARVAIGGRDLEHLVLVLVQVIAQIQQQLARRKRLAADRRRAMRGAAAALRARVHVEHLFPGELVDVRGAECRGVLQVLLAQSAGRLELLEEHVRRGGDDVEVLRDRQQVHEDEDDAVVHPPAGVAREFGETGAADRHQRQTDERAERLPGTFTLDVGSERRRVEVPAVIQKSADHYRADEAEDE